MISIDIVIPTKMTDKEFEATTQFKCIESIINSTHMTSEEFHINLITETENTTGLSEVYQNRLNSSTADYILFMHDDLEIHDHFIFKKLVKAHEQYDIVGLAGATSQNYGMGKPTVWHLSREQVEDARGIVGHMIPKGFNGVKETHVNSAYFGPTPSRVAVIDGLFMSFKRTSLIDKPELFDKDFTFHHYDMAMCVNAVRNKLTIGVWPIYVVHSGLGDFNADPLWHELANKFKAKYGNYKYSV